MHSWISGDVAPETAVARCEGFAQGFNGVAAQEIHGGSAEAASHDAGSENAGDGESGVDQEIQFEAAYVVVIAEAPVGLGHQAAHFAGVSALGGGGEGFDTDVFANDVPGASLQCAGERFEVGESRIAQGGDAQGAGGFGVFGDAGAVGGIGEFMTDHRVYGEDGEIRGKLHGAPLEGSAVEQDRGTRLAVGGCKLVHDAAGDANEIGFGGVGNLGDLQGIAGASESEGGGDAERGG